MLKRPLVVLIILDGWGIAPAGPGNAITLAKTPTINRLMAYFPRTSLTASGESVGLPHREKGNSETGHLNLGAGRIVYQDLPRINMAIADGSFFNNQAFLQATKYVKEKKSNLHLLGLLGQGGTHANIEHLFALMLLAKKEGVKQLFLHLFTDGRDSPPKSALAFFAQVNEKIKDLGIGKIASVSGRYYALDRDNRWERTKKTYEALVLNIGEKSNSTEEAVNNAYRAGLSDEFILPTVIIGEGEKPISLISDNDAVIFYNYRIDRPRQLTKAFILSDLENLKGKKMAFDPYTEKYYKKTYSNQVITETFKRKKVLQNLFFVTMTEYEENMPCKNAFPPTILQLPLARVIAENNLKQLHISETEKERFVTYYFNGQIEAPFLGEDRIEIPSVKVPTYDLKPEMSAFGIAETVIKKIRQNLYNFIVINFANPDMVGHTGVLEAGIRACEAIDSCLSKIVNEVLARGDICLITADHGNVEEMINLNTGEVDTEHSMNPVPFIYVNKKVRGRNRFLPSGILADVAPTVLYLLKLNKPGIYTGRNLLENFKEAYL